MTNNEVLKRLRYALQLKDHDLIAMLAESGLTVTPETLAAWFKQEDEEGYAVCDDRSFAGLLDGLIVARRGRQENADGKPRPPETQLNNNLILKKLRIALNFREDEMIKTLANAGVTLSKSELNALFRRPGHRNYQECGDQFLRNFIKGLETPKQ